MSDSLDKANAFNKYFSSVSVPDNGTTPTCPTIVLLYILDTISIGESDVIRSIKGLKAKSSSGPDGIPPILFKELRSCLSFPLAIIFNQFISIGYVPDVWKKAIIVPVHKKGVTGKVENYRPISLTCVASKIMEKIVSWKIIDHLHANNILHRAQHGFLKRRSTSTNLLETLNDWTVCLQSKCQVTVVYIDFRKAFDIVSHQKLYTRLYSYGIRGTVLLWLKKFFHHAHTSNQS